MEFDKTPRFWYPHVALAAWINFAFSLDENLRSDFHRSKKKSEKRNKKNQILSHSLHALHPFHLTFLLSLKKKIIIIIIIIIVIIIIIIIILDTWFILLHSGPFLPRNNLFLFSSHILSTLTLVPKGKFTYNGFSKVSTSTPKLFSDYVAINMNMMHPNLNNTLMRVETYPAY